MAWATETPPGSATWPDAPMFLVDNAADYDAGSHAGRWAATRSMSASDATLSGFPATRARDGLWHVFTKPSSDAATWYLNLYTDPAKPIDAVVLLGHNFHSAPSGFAWELVTADDDSFATNVEIMTSESTGITSKRRVMLLDDRYTGVARVSLKVSAASAWRPQIGEIILARRIQAELPPREPYDDQATRSTVHRSVSPAGIEVSTQPLKGQRTVPLDFILSGAAERDAFRDLYQTASHGGASVVLIDHPVEDPGAAYVMALPDAFGAPMTRAPYEYQAALELVERGPFYLVE